MRRAEALVLFHSPMEPTLYECVGAVLAVCKPRGVGSAAPRRTGEWNRSGRRADRRPTTRPPTGGADRRQAAIGKRRKRADLPPALSSVSVDKRAYEAIMRSSDRVLTVFLCHGTEDKPAVRELYK